jgi:hypothetical protein
MRKRPSLYRRPTRHSVRIPCQIVRERDFKLIADQITDLSVNGLQTGPSDPILTGERLIVSFKSPRWGVWIDVDATVARIVHGRRPGEWSRSLGIEFDKLDPWSRFVLEHNLKKIPLIPPGARTHFA